MDFYNDNLEANGEGPFPECSIKFKEIRESWRSSRKLGRKKEGGNKKEERRQREEGRKTKGGFHVDSISIPIHEIQP